MRGEGGNVAVGKYLQVSQRSPTTTRYLLQRISDILVAEVNEKLRCGDFVR